MKKLILIAAVLIATATLQSCAGGKNIITPVANYLKDNGEVKTEQLFGANSKVYRTTATLSNMWKTAEIKRAFPTATITIDVANSKATAEIVYNIDSIATLKGGKYVKAIQNLIGK